MRKIALNTIIFVSTFTFIIVYFLTGYLSQDNFIVIIVCLAVCAIFAAIISIPSEDI